MAARESWLSGITTGSGRDEEMKIDKWARRYLASELRNAIVDMVEVGTIGDLGRYVSID
jgi:predicted methyltransferase MtxX (methanogen marker protein 4)